MIFGICDTKFSEAWQRLWETQLWQSPLYTLSAYDFYRQRPIDEGANVTDVSFVVMDEQDDFPVLGLRGAIVEQGDVADLLAYEVPCHLLVNPSATSESLRRGEKEFLAHLRSLVEKVNGKVGFRDHLNDGSLSFLGEWMLRTGGRARPYFSVIIDLQLSRDALFRQVRKSYKSLINWGDRNLTLNCLGSGDLKEQELEGFRKLHLEVSGKETRSRESWRRQYDMVQAGDAFVILGYLENELVTAGFFMHTRDVCYYGSSASRRDLFSKPLFHAMLWQGILHAKSLGCRWFDVGERRYPNQGCPPPTEKELSISMFKAGFGGVNRLYLDIELDGSSVEST